MPGRMRRAAALGATAKVASTRGQAKGAAAAEQAAAAAAAPPAPPASPPAPVAPAASAPASTAAADNYDTLMKLQGLLDAGVLSQEEFEAEKRKVLGA